MTSGDSKPLIDPVLAELGVVHGFGTRGSDVPKGAAFPRQVHGRAVARAEAWSKSETPAADAIVSTRESPCIGIVTADCVPILLASGDGSRVAAIHAGWRGLAAGVIEAGLAAFLESQTNSGPEGANWRAAIGPAARACCYEVDEPVREGLAERYAADLAPEVMAPGRTGHFQLDLPLLATRVLIANGADSTRIGTSHRVCTICDPGRFESYRRDGEAAGRLRHFIAAGKPRFDQG